MASSTTEFAVPDKVRDQQLDDDPELLRHVKRPQWGLAILAWERGDRRAYQFEDGRLRKFKKGYYDLMQPAESTQRSEDAVIADLQAAIGTPRSATRKTLRPDATFEQQIAFFESQYPGGFQGETWTEEHRGTPEGRDLKRHRDPVIAEAQRVLSAGEVATYLGEERFRDLAEAVLEILSSTDLVGLRNVKILREMDDDQARLFAEAVAELLHGEGDFGPRFKPWVKVLRDLLDGKPSWRLATVLPALMQPDEHVCVRHSAFIRQAASIAPTSRYSRRPKARAYRNFRRVARVARTRLEAAGHEPRDLMDVHDFVWNTLRDSALDQMDTGSGDDE